MTQSHIKRPDGCKEEHLEFLADLRESGATNMYGSAPYLEDFDLDLTERQVAKIILYWMETFKARMEAKKDA